MSISESIYSEGGIVSYVEQFLEDNTLQECIDHLLATGIFKEILKKILLDNSNELHNAHKHPLGFVKITLAKSEDLSLRLHYWPGQSHETQPHNHRRTFASHILMGTLQVTTFVEVDEGIAGAEAYTKLYCEHKGLDGYVLSERGATPLFREKSKLYKASQTYLQPCEDVHSVAACGDGVTATIVLEGEQVADSSTAYKKISQEHQKTVLNGNCTCQEIECILKDVIRVL